VHFLGPVKLPYIIDKINRAIAKLTRLLFNKEYNTKHTILLSLYFARKLRQKMKGQHYDCILAPAASTDLAFLKLDAPLIYFSDATFRLIVDAYVWEYGKIAGFSRREGDYIERKALRKSDAYILASEWAAKSAINDYGVPKDKIVIMPLCANIDYVPPREMIFNKEQNEELTLLYLAVEWGRKGGDIAFEALQELHQQGIRAKLIVCGCIPPPEVQHPFLEVIPFLNKNKKEDYDKFVSLLSSVHFLILPTRADCSLIVAGEANSYGVPAITTKVGGVPDVVKDGVNGYCLPYEARGDAYASVIKKVFFDKAAYHNLIEGSRERYEQRLNWDKWTEDFVRLYQSIVIDKRKNED
jgi:glycosyltransferase involved in cell wall biosynthesis